MDVQSISEALRRLVVDVGHAAVADLEGAVGLRHVGRVVDPAAAAQRIRFCPMACLKERRAAYLAMRCSPRPFLRLMRTVEACARTWPPIGFLVSPNMAAAPGSAVTCSRGAALELWSLGVSCGAAAWRAEGCGGAPGW